MDQRGSRYEEPDAPVYARFVSAESLVGRDGNADPTNPFARLPGSIGTQVRVFRRTPNIGPVVFLLVSLSRKNGATNSKKGTDRPNGTDSRRIWRAWSGLGFCSLGPAPQLWAMGLSESVERGGLCFGWFPEKMRLPCFLVGWIGEMQG